MMTIIVAVLMAANGAACVVAGYYVLSAINRMGSETREAIKAAYWLKAVGLFTQVCAVADYFHGDPLAWPWLLLAGVAMTNAGTGLLYLVNRRACRCPECPVRRIACPEQGRPA